VTTTLLVIIPWIPAYRVTFFNRLEEVLAVQGIRLVVARCDPPPSMVRRGDTAGGPWARDVPTSWVNIGGLEIPRRRIASTIRELRPDLVIVEQALHNPETYLLLLSHAMGRHGLAMWGHGRSYSSSQSAAEASLKQWLTRRGDWFFAHTQGGVDHVVAHGFPRARASALNNTIDTERLRSDLAAVDRGELDMFRAEQGLSPGRTALFLGGVDPKKGISFLLESARAAGELMPGFVLLIGGEGESMLQAQAAQASGVPVRLLGRADGRVKALALCAADVLAIPEQVGLVAVDALVSGRPVITTCHPSHGPEYDYLVPGQTSVVAAHTVVDYAGALVATLTAGVRLGEMQVAAQRASYRYALDAMVDSFAEGVLGWRDLRAAGLATGTGSSRRATDLGASRRIPVMNNSLGGTRLVAVLMTCFNRREQTLLCLGALRAQDLSDTELRVYLTDDGSTDGTASAVSAIDMPVRVIAGSGDLYWAAGMALAEREALRDDPDLLLWVNDDVTLDPDGLARLLTIHDKAPDSIVVGNLRDPVTGEKTYGGRNRLGRHPQRFLAAPPAGHLQQVSGFNGNVVLVPRGVRYSVGPIDGSFAHAYADDDYGLRASRSGVPILCAADTVGTCSAHKTDPTPTGVRAAWRQLQDPTGLPWRSQVRYLRRHGRRLWPAYLVWGYGKAIIRASMR
jgi:GT2 family glycosyltransferase/glycosyltransferase involved in cell wall biosynthesis